MNEDKLFVGKARMRARDIRAAMKGSNVDPIVIQTLEVLAEQDSTLRTQINLLAERLNECIDLVSNLIEVMTAMRNKLDAERMDKVVQNAALNDIKIKKLDDDND